MDLDALRGSTLRLFGSVADLFVPANQNTRHTNPSLDASHRGRYIHRIGVRYELLRVSKVVRVVAITPIDFPYSVVGSCRIYWDPLCVTETLARGQTDFAVY